MDKLPVDVLTAVCNFLPVKERLRSRLLSSKLGQVQCDPTPNDLAISQKADVVSFRLRLKGVADCYRRRTIVIINEEIQKEDYYFYQRYEIAKEDGLIQKTTIHCIRPKFHQLVDLYISLFIRHFAIYKLQLVNLSDVFLDMIRCAFLRLQPNLDWGKNHQSLTMYTRNRQLTVGEREFLKYNPVTFTFSPPADFQPLDDFWQLGPFTKSNGILLRFGHLPDGSKEKQEVAVDLGIGDSFLEKLVAERKKRFVVNTSLNISVDFLIRYIENCLKGNHTMYTLYFRQTYNDDERRRLTEFLDDHGFENYAPWLYALPMNRKTKKGYEPDELIVGIHTNVVQVLGDFACYRGRHSKQSR